MKRPTRLTTISPWLMATACLILVAILAVFVFSNYRREQRLRDEALAEKGRSLIAAVHTGLRVSLRAAAREEVPGDGTTPAPLRFVERMREAIGQLPEDEDVRAIYLTDGEGRIVAGGNPDVQVEQLDADERQFLAGLQPGQLAHWREDSGRWAGSFLVTLRYRAGQRLPFVGNGAGDGSPNGPPSSPFGFRRYHRLGAGGGGNRGGNMGMAGGAGYGALSRHWTAWQEELRALDDKRLSLVVVLDPERFNAAVRRQMWQIFALAASVLLVGLGGWLSLIAVQGWRGSQERLGRLEEELRRHERLAALGKMAAGVAHELRNPLSSIKGLALILREKLPTESRQDGVADLLIEEVGRLNRAIGDLLAYAKPPQLEKKRISLNDTARRALELIRPDASAMGISLDFTAAAEVMVDADADKLSQVLLNLLMNAMQAMEKMEDGRIGVAVTVEKGEAKLTVSDTGGGISRENLSKIFDPYFTTKSSGAGLGLALSAQIIEEHGGKIAAYSEPGRGARLECLLPLATVGGGVEASSSPQGKSFHLKRV